MDQGFEDWGLWRGEHTNRRRRPWCSHHEDLREICMKFSKALHRRNLCMRTVVVGLSVRITRRDLREIYMKSSKA